MTGHFAVIQHKPHGFSHSQETDTADAAEKQAVAQAFAHGLADGVLVVDYLLFPCCSRQLRGLAHRARPGFAVRWVVCGFSQGKGLESGK